MKYKALMLGITVLLILSGANYAAAISIWNPDVTVGADGGALSVGVELGVKFRSDAAGYINGIRFYKYPGNTGTHTGSLWAANGALLGQVVFSSESASGWQEASFAAPIPIAANTTYVASYHTAGGHFAFSSNYFASAGVDNAPLHALRNGVDGPNGVFAFSAASVFPSATYQSGNYWVDVNFSYNPAPKITSTPALTGQVNVPYQYDVNATGTPAPTYDFDPPNSQPAGMTIDNTTGLITWTPTLAGPYPVAVKAINGFGSDSQTFTINVSAPSSKYTIWNPGVTVGADGGALSVGVQLGVKFRSDVDGYINGVRFYKHPGNTGAHTGSLWTTGGVLLGQVVFSNESASGWQEASFAAPIPIAANTTYIASYHTATGHFAFSSNYFGAAGYDNAPLHALRNGLDGPNGVFAFGSASVFPNATYLSSNYWVDVAFSYNPAPRITSTPILVGQPNVPYQYDVNASGIPAPTYDFDPANSQPAGMTIDSASGLITWTPTADGTYNVTVKATNSSGSDSQTFTINVSSQIKYTIWNPSVPVGAMNMPGYEKSVELGLKFRSDVAGYITGVRYYRYPQEVGPIVGSLWSMHGLITDWPNNGTLLGQVTFPDPTSSGWQEASFAAPIPIAANTDYLVSVWTFSGYFAYTPHYLQSAEYYNPPLHALQSGVNGLNSVFLFSWPPGTFPNHPWVDPEYSGANYWVDVAFVPQ